MTCTPRHCIYFAVTWGTKSDKSSISTDSTLARNIFLYGLKQKVWLSTNHIANVLVTLSGTKIWTTPQRLLLTVNSPPKKRLRSSAYHPAHWENGAALMNSRDWVGKSAFVGFFISSRMFSLLKKWIPIAHPMKHTYDLYWNPFSLASFTSSPIVLCIHQFLPAP